MFIKYNDVFPRILDANKSDFNSETEAFDEPSCSKAAKRRSIIEKLC